MELSTCGLLISLSALKSKVMNYIIEATEKRTQLLKIKRIECGLLLLERKLGLDPL